MRFATHIQGAGRLLWPQSYRQRRLRRRWLLRGGAALLGAGIILAAAGVWHPLDAVLRIRAVRVVAIGPEVCDRQALRDRVDVKCGDSFLSVRPGLLAAQITQDPRIAEVAIRYGWFHELIVEVTERTAVATLIGPEGGFCEVASDGVLLEVLGELPADLPLVSWEGQTPTSPLAPGERLDLRGAPDLCDLLARLRTLRPTLWRGISEARLLADGTCEFYWNDAAIVAWSRGPVADLRLDAWAAVMSDLTRRGERDAVVDLRYRDQIVVRFPEEGTTPAGNAG